MTWLLGLGGLLKSALSDAFGWIRANPWPAILIGLSVALAWLWHDKHKAQQRIVAIEAVRKADAITWSAADKLNHRTINDLIDTLLEQSRMVRAWGEAAKIKQDAAQAALRAATTRGTHMEASANAIDLERSQRGASWPACRSGKAVMSARGDL